MLLFFMHITMSTGHCMEFISLYKTTMLKSKYNVLVFYPLRLCFLACGDLGLVGLSYLPCYIDQILFAGSGNSQDDDPFFSILCPKPKWIDSSILFSILTVGSPEL